MRSRSSDRPLVIIPTFNERDNVSRLIPAILDSDPGLHVLVVDDGSPDDTAGAVLKLKEKEYAGRIFLNSRPGKLGLGSAYVDGFIWGLANGYDFLIEMDGDWSHHPRYLATILQLAVDADFVIGSRYVSGGGTLNWGAGRRALSRLGSLYTRLILEKRIKDFTGGFNGWSAAVLRKINLNTLKSNGYSFQIELKYRAHKLGFRHTEFPIVFEERRIGKSKISSSIVMEALWRVVGLRFLRNEISGEMNPPTHPVETKSAAHNQKSTIKNQ